MRADYEVKICDICKKRIKENMDFVRPIQTPITIKMVEDRYEIIKEFRDICDDCRNSIADFIVKNLYVSEYPKFEVFYDKQKIEKMEENNNEQAAEQSEDAVLPRFDG